MMRQFAGNVGWLFLDRVLRMGVGLLVGVWIARYLGPADFGLLNYALALTALFTAVAGMGLYDIVVRDIIGHPDRVGETLGTAMALQAVGGVVAFVFAVGSVIALRPDDPRSWLMTGLCAVALLGQCGDVVRAWFEARVQSRNVVWVANGVFVAMTLVRVVLIATDRPLAWFGLTVGIEAVLTTVALIVMFLREGRAEYAKARLQVSARRAWQMLHASWPLALSSVAIILNMKIDQVMLGQMIGDRPLGVFSAAVRLSEVWYFIPVAISASAFPFIAREADPAAAARRWQQLYAAMLWLSVGAAVFTTLFGHWIVTTLYGPAFAPAAPVLAVHIWGGVNVALGLVWSRWIMLENRLRLVLMVQVIGAVLNIALNLVLIPRMGIMGAALATLGSYWISGTLSYTVHRPRVTFGYLWGALTPWRLLHR